MSAVIAPAILAENAAQYKEQVDRITGFVERVHIDVSDGEFAPTLTVGIQELWAPEGWTIDIHAMVNNLEEYIPKLIVFGIVFVNNLLIIHGLFCRGTLDIGYHIAFIYLVTLLCFNLNELASKCCRDSFELAPRRANITESVAFFVLFTNEWFNSGSCFTVSLELPEDLTFNR